MNELLVDPTAVLLVGGSPSVVETVGSRLTDGSATDVVQVETLDAGVETLETRDDVGCAVVLGTRNADVRAVPERLRAVADRLPVVVHVDDHDVELVGDLARWADCRFVPRSTAPETLRAAVDDAIATFDRRRQEAADSRLFQTLLNEADISMFAKDDRGRYVRTTGLTETHHESDIIGRTDREVFGSMYPRSAESAYRDDLSVVESGEAIREQRERFGNDFWSESTKLPVRDEEGDVTGLVGFALDVTNEVENERRLTAQNRRFEKFASYVSHDLRTPLQIAFGALDRARDGDEEALDKLEDAHDRIEEIIGDLRELTDEDPADESPTLPGEVDSTVASTDLVSLVEKIWGINAPREATIEFDVPDGTIVVAESEVLRPLVENLLKNAFDHAGPSVTVRVGLIEERGFYVADDGPGIPETERERAVEQGYTTSEEGSGTGLAIVNETALREGWDLSIGESQAGGARFEISDCPVVVPREASAGAALSLDSSVDVGDVAVRGDAEYDPEGDRWTVTGAGEDFWGDVDEMHFVFAETDGPVRIDCRVDRLEAVHEYSKAGVMVRDSLEPGASLVYVGTSGDHGSETIWSAEYDSLTTSVQYEEPSGAYPWYRIERIGDTVTSYLSRDGEEWQPIDQRRSNLGDPVAVGLVVCSHSETDTATAEFSNVSVNRLRVADDRV